MADEETGGAGGVAALARANAPVIEGLVPMTLDTFERSGPDQETYLLARIAALAAMDTSTPSYLLNIVTAREVGVPLEKIQGTLVPPRWAVPASCPPPAPDRGPGPTADARPASMIRAAGNQAGGPSMSHNATTAMRVAPHTTPEERAAFGKEARRRSPRSGHAVYRPPPDRPDPLAILEAQSAARVPELVPIRYGRMMESPFRFYRGAAAIMASDLAGSPVSGLTAQLCGDAHMLNFRLLASPERQLVFDINDFDETLPGPWEWDVKRLSASLVIAGRGNGFDDAERARIVSSTVSSYREAMIRFAKTGNLGLWYAKIDADLLESMAAGRLHKRGQKNVARALAKARTRDSLQAFDKLTETVDGQRRIAADPPLLIPAGDLLPDIERSALERQFRSLIERYGRTLTSDRRTLLADYRLADVARKVVGVGSVGTRCWIFLLLGRDGQDPLFLQAKEADASVLAPHVGASRYRNQGERVVSGQRLMQATSDIFLGWERVDGIDGKQRDFYVRQLRDWKGIAMPERMQPKDMQAFGELCGVTLARAHARSGDRIAIAAYLGGGDSFDRALATFAEAYADRNERDHQALVDAVHAGRLPAEELPAA